MSAGRGGHLLRPETWDRSRRRLIVPAIAALGLACVAIAVALLVGPQVRQASGSCSADGEPLPATALPAAAAGPLLDQPSLPKVLCCRPGYVDLRRHPDAKSELVTQVLYGQSLRVLERSGQWLRVQVIEQGNYPGWLLAEAGVVLPAQLAGLPACVVRRPSASVRASSDGGGRLATGWPSWLPGGSLVRVSGGDGRFTRVISVTGAPGWLETAALSGTKDEGMLPLVAAQGYVGTTYLWGGLTQRGIDCSGLVWASHRQCGMTLPRDAKDQARSGRPVAKSSLRPGDCVFFSSNGKTATHVGIFLGHDKFIQSCPSKGVSIANLSQTYYARRYFCATRFAPGN